MADVFYSEVEKKAFGYNGDNGCPRLTNGLHAIHGHCVACNNLIRASIPRPYPIRDYLNRIIVSDAVVIE